MKKYRVLSAFLCCLLLAGCGKTENPYRVDTVVRIPVNPTEAAVETEAAAETQMQTEVTEATEAPKASSGKSPAKSPKKSSSSGNKTSSSEKPSTPKETVPAATEPEETAAVLVGAGKETEPQIILSSGTEPARETEAAATEAPYDPSSYSVGSLEYVILDELNGYRREEGLEELTMSSRLCGIAALRAQEIVRLWSHTRPDGRNYTSAMTDYGYGFSTSAENLVHVSGSGDAAAIVSKWMSADNRGSILSDAFTAAGVGVYRSGGVTYVVNLLVG